MCDPQALERSGAQKFNSLLIDVHGHAQLSLARQPKTKRHCSIATTFYLYSATLGSAPRNLLSTRVRSGFDVTFERQWVADIATD